MWDHTATLDARIFTTCVALAFRPGDAVESRECGARDPTPQVGCALRRGARRSVLWIDWLSRRAQHLASGASRDSAYLLGLAKPLLRLCTAASLPGCPCICLSDASLDDAGQITAGQDLPVQCGAVTASDGQRSCAGVQRSRARSSANHLRATRRRHAARFCGWSASETAWPSRDSGLARCCGWLRSLMFCSTRTASLPCVTGR